MRVITGLAKGRKLKEVEDNNVRPTSGKVKEAVFSIIQFKIANRKFLDLFAGTGQMGIEALSREAKKVVFVDNNKKCINTIKMNLQNISTPENSEVFQMDASSFLNVNNDKFDIAFLDPPYNKNLLKELLPSVINVMNDNGTVICEHPKEEILQDNIFNFHKVKTYKYGTKMITSYEYNGEL